LNGHERRDSDKKKEKKEKKEKKQPVADVGEHRFAVQCIFLERNKW
jgi:hypothetical protein